MPIEHLLSKEKDKKRVSKKRGIEPSDYATILEPISDTLWWSKWDGVLWKCESLLPGTVFDSREQVIVVDRSGNRLKVAKVSSVVVCEP